MPKRRNVKYGNTKFKVDGVTWDSAGEYRRWKELQLLQKAGMICELTRQKTYFLAPAVVIEGRKKPVMKFTLDFQYIEKGELILEDFKSPATAAEVSFRMRLHLLKWQHGLDVRLSKR